MHKRRWIKRGFAGILALALFFPGTFGGVSVQAGKSQIKDENYEKRAVKEKNKGEKKTETIRNDFWETEVKSEEGRQLSGKTSVPLKTADRSVAAYSGNGRYKESIEFNVPSKSSDGYKDDVTFSLKSWKTTGDGRNDSNGAVISLSSSGNSCTANLSNLLDYETYTVVVSYTQVYYFKSARTGTATDSDGKTYTYTYYVKESKTTKGTLSGTATTQTDTIIRNAYDLKEKVHKYSSLSLATDIDCGVNQSDIDGLPRKKWLVNGNISSVVIDGCGHTIKRSLDGFIFHVFNGAGFTLSNAVVHAFSGTLFHKKTYGGEYEIINSTGSDKSSGIEVGYDSSFDAHDSSKGRLSLINSTIIAKSNAIVARNGAAEIKKSYLYGMGDKDGFFYSNFDDYLGTGILVQNSGSVHAEVKMSESTLYARHNGMLLQGDSNASIKSCEVRGDCGDAFDFRSSGSLDIRQTKIFGIIGIDIFDDASSAAVDKALSGKHFDGKLFSQKIGKKGTVTVSDTTMSLNTGAFLEDANRNSLGIQNRGNVIIGKNVSISTVHSKAWNTVSDGKRAVSYGIYNCMRLELPSDIKIASDDIGVTENRNIGIIRNYIYLKGGDDNEAAEVEKAVTRNDDIFEVLDNGNNSILTITGGEIKAYDTGINAPFGSVYIEPERKLTVAGKLKGIVTGKDKIDNIFGDEANGGYLEINGPQKTYIYSSLQGQGLSVLESGRAVLLSKDIEISDNGDKCGTAVMNKGQLYLKNAFIKAQKAGINNLGSGRAYIGDNLDEKGNQVRIFGAVCGIINDGTMFYYRDVVIKNSIKAAVWQNGIFYMLPGAAVKTGDTENAVFLTSNNKYEKSGRSTVRILYEKQYQDDLPLTEASFNTAANDREPGREMVRLYSPDGTTDLSDTAYKRIDDKEKLRITRLLTGFSLCFDQINGHKADLRCGLGSYVPDEEKKAKLQPKAGTATNGRTGTIVLSCLLSGIYDADFPVKDSRITSKAPETTEFYWREPQEFMTAPLSFKEDRCQIFWNEKDITAGLKQKGYRDKNKNGYKKTVYDKDRIIRIYSEDHTFYAVWDTDFAMIFDGNGQTNGVENYTREPVDGNFVFDGNTGPDGTYEEYFEKSITRKRFDYEIMADRTYQHQTSFQGFSFDKNAIYRDDGVYCKGDKLHGSAEIVTDEGFSEDYPNYGALSFYICAVEKGNVSIDDDRASVRIYVVWDEFPVLTAQDISFYANELSDESAVLDRLLSEKAVKASDSEDGDIDRKYIAVYTDPTRKIFSIDDLKQMGDSGSVIIYYSVTDKNNADLMRFKQNCSVSQAKVSILSDDSEDTSDDIPESTDRGNAGTSSDTFYSAPVYVRALSLSDIDTLEARSVWREESYRKLLGQAAGEESQATEKWVFGTGDIIRSKEFLYRKNADVLTWRNEFIANCVMDEKTAENQKNKPMIVNEGLSSLHLTWDIKSETDSVSITLSQWGDSGTKTIERKANQRMCSGTVFSDLKSDAVYLVTADFYYRGKKLLTYKETVHTKKLEKPVVKVCENNTGDRLELQLSCEKDPRARKYVIERRCLKGEKPEGYQVIKEIDEFTENEKGERYFDSDVINYHTSIDSEGVYRYRIRALGSRLFSDELTEKSEYSDEIETAFLKKPEIKSTEAGCRSVRVYLKEQTAADFVRLHYQTLSGEKHYMDIEPDKKFSGIISELMTDDTVYAISAESHITSSEGGREYTSLKSETAEERTLKLTTPKLLYKKQSEIYTGDGIRLIFRFDENAISYQLKEDRLYPDKKKGAFETIDTTKVKDVDVLPSKDGSSKDKDSVISYAGYKRKGGDSRVSEYTIRAAYKTLDGKKFHLRSEKVRAGYIRIQKNSGKRIDQGSRHKEQIAYDANASVYLLTIRSSDSTEEIFIPSDRDYIDISSPGKERNVDSLKTVLIYDGVEYRAL